MVLCIQKHGNEEKVEKVVARTKSENLNRKNISRKDVENTSKVQTKNAKTKMIRSKVKC